MRWLGTAAVGTVATALGAWIMRRRREDGGSRPVQRLVGVCRNAEVGARMAVDIFAYDSELEAFFNKAAADYSAFGTELIRLLPEGGVAAGKSMRGRVFHWRLRLARRVRLGSRLIDDHRINLRVMRRGSRRVLRAYDKAVAGDLDPEVRREIRSQAEVVRMADAKIRAFADAAKYASRGL